ncbi:N-methylhydantoinase A [Angulomicrobium tetraedrale]|uniref:N-methylhydantoinase A n=1 Tax=Ancylobacter tetraedralis TaxID=217068 RepID=A0A839ZB31_9HYPH|nr:hydantoinase/oxoprolinase family protein [Ancylobacter tetraedralis]MBB3771926.1 N-methylhydantoinase A [Ancylobacter tetraedralis]
MDTVGVDTGGTFCDLVVIDAQGQTSVHKSPSTPHDNAQGVFDVLRVAEGVRSGSAGTFYSNIESFSLGTTIATNTVVTHTGAKVGLITTMGHADMISIMRVNGRVAGRPLSEIQNYSITSKPAPIIPKTRIVELNERIDYAGDVVIPLKDDEALAAIARLVAAGVESIAVSLLWSFVNPAHEQRIEALIKERHPEIFVSLGSSLSRRLGEYERTEAAVINGYVAIEVKKYLQKVSGGLASSGVTTPMLVMHSAGGVGTEANSSQRPITTLFSGPAGGVVASRRVCEAAGYRNVVCADVGGTTFDVGLIVDGRPLIRSTSIIDQRVLYCPTIDIVSIGAGGGSIAFVDPVTRRLSVGPQSAGAFPGPACYGRGGAYPTVTDANLVLGYMDPVSFLGGRFPLDRAAAEAALETHVAGPLGISVEEAAIGIFSIVNAKMADLVRKVTVERGHDPRDFVLCAYGGLGPLHAPFYASDLDAMAVLIPLGEISSAFSAYGVAMADVLHVHERSITLREPFVQADIRAVFDELVDEAHAQLQSDGIAARDRQMRHFVEVRYVGQLNDLVVEIPDLAIGGGEIRAMFEQLYVEAFGPGAAWDNAPIEIVGFRLEAIGLRNKYAVGDQPVGPAPVPIASREVYWPQSGAYVATAIYRGGEVLTGARIEGPAILEYSTTTITVPPKWNCGVDRVGNLILKKSGSAS